MIAGIFNLVNPPTPEDAAVIEKTVAHCDFPWEVLKGYMAQHFIDAIDVKWIPENNAGNATASWWGTGSIEISQQFDSWRDDLPFVFIHECGHMVDQMVLNEADHKELTTILHSGPGMGGMMAHSNSGQFYRHPNEDWSDTVDNDYVARLNEDFADQFVAAFAPDLWNGTAADVPSRQHFPRFVHYSDDNAGVRRVVSAAVDRITHPTPAPTPTPRPVVMSRGQLIDEALASINAWVKKNPKSKNRLRVRIAQRALRSIKPQPIRSK